MLSMVTLHDHGLIYVTDMILPRSIYCLIKCIISQRIWTVVLLDDGKLLHLPSTAPRDDYKTPRDTLLKPDNFGSAIGSSSYRQMKRAKVLLLQKECQ